MTHLKQWICVAIILARVAMAQQDAPAPAQNRDEAVGAASTPQAIELVRTVRSGAWSDPGIWEKGKVPSAGTSVLIREGHDVAYDVVSEQAIRAVYISGKLRFVTDRDTRLDVGLIKISRGDDISESGFHCNAPDPSVPDPGHPRGVLEVGTPDQPIHAAHSATIRLVYFEGMDPKSFPAIVCCGGQMDFHGAEMSRTWVKLGAEAKKDSAEVVLSEPVSGWRKGDRVIITGAVRQNKIAKTFVFPPGSVRDRTQTEERTIVAVDGSKLTFDTPLAFDHVGTGDFRNEVANLSRNVVVESADSKQRGHTMYHKNSAGSISYAEFRHLGKEGVLGRYSLHYHLVRDSMRGSYVIGASIWDSANRWLTIHGTNYLVVRDCVGYNSIGHGFFLEDGTEQYNVLDRNIAVQARHGNILPDQVLPFDHNAGGGFWWGNCLNTFTRNVAAECDEYGYRFDMQKTADFSPVLSVRGIDGKPANIDVRTLPYVRFEDNESHCQRRHSFNLGGYGIDDKNLINPESMTKYGVAGVGPDQKHPMLIRNCRAWNTHWAFHALSPYVMVDQFDVYSAEYGFWLSPWTQHAYRGLHLKDVRELNLPAKPALPSEDKFPNGLNVSDELPPQTVITHVAVAAPGKLRIWGVAADNGDIKQVLVNGQTAKALRPNFAEWEIIIDDPRPATTAVTARAEDNAGNVENTPHSLELGTPAARKAEANPKEKSTGLFPPTTGPAPALMSPRQDVEWSMEVGCQHCHFSEETGIQTCVQNCGPAGCHDGKIYFLRGKTSKEFGKGGIWLVKGAMSHDGRTVVVDEMKMIAEALDDKASSTVSPPPDKLTEWSGTVFHTGKFLPSLTVDDKKFGLKPSKTATSEVRAMLTRIGGGDLTGKFTVNGTTYKDDSREWIVVETIRQNP